MLKAYYNLLGGEDKTSLPIYVNFKLSLKLEPLYVNTANAAFWFRQWLVLMVYKGLHRTLVDAATLSQPSGLIPVSILDAALLRLESGRPLEIDSEEALSTGALCSAISKLLNVNGFVRCVLLLDDAAHAFSPKQQEDFFEFFREIKSREISPKAAIYPGITNHSPTFQVGHDAEQIDAWVRPDRAEYVSFMRSLAVKRFRGDLPGALADDHQVIDFLAYAAFGVPRAFLAMLRSAFEDISSNADATALDRRKLLAYARQARESSHNVYDSLAAKLPAYREFVSAGRNLYQSLLISLKDFNKGREENNQAVEVALKKPIPPEIQKVVGFFQYAGLLMPGGDNSRGIKGVFELYFVHFGDLITENAIVGRRTKTVPAFLTALTSQTHQAWPRISPDTLVKPDVLHRVFRLSLPQCQTCGAERVNEHARFCPNCGSQLKTASLYDDLVAQSIDVLPISRRLSERVKSGSSIRTIKDVLMDSDRRALRGAPYIGPVRAAKIAYYAEEYLA